MDAAQNPSHWVHLPVQARVFELVDGEGRPVNKVVKIAHTDLGHKAINSVWISMEREWELGLKLRAALQEPDGRLPGFMRVCDAIVSGDGRRVRFAGMILEELHGWEVYKRIGECMALGARGGGRQRRAHPCMPAKTRGCSGKAQDQHCQVSDAFPLYAIAMQTPPSFITCTTFERCCGR